MSRKPVILSQSRLEDQEKLFAGHLNPTLQSVLLLCTDSRHDWLRTSAYLCLGASAQPVGFFSVAIVTIWPNLRKADVLERCN